MWIETESSIVDLTKFSVTPLAGVWIETIVNRQPMKSRIVTPLAGVWIETAPCRLKSPRP